MSDSPTHRSPLPARHLKRYAAAEEVCRAFRCWTTMRACDRTEQHGHIVMQKLIKWMDLTPKNERYGDPKGWPE